MISKSYTKIVWNLNSNKVTPTPLGVTSDTGRGIEVRIKVDEIFQTPENTLRLAAEKEDGTALYLTADIVSGRYLFTKLAQVFSYSGKVTARLELQQGTDFISSENFVFEVPPSVAMSMIQSSSDFTALQKALTKTEAAFTGLGFISDNEKLRVAAEQLRSLEEKTRAGSELKRKEDEAYRLTAETERASAESARVTAENERASAELGRVTAETERANAEIERANAETERASAESARVTAEQERAALLENLEQEVTEIKGALKHIKLESWTDVQKAVRDGSHKNIISIGDSFVAKYGGVDYTWDVIGINHDMPADSNYTNSLTIQSRDCLMNCVFDAPELLYFAEEILPVGDYKFYDSYNSKNYAFSIATPVTEGGGIIISAWGESNTPTQVRTSDAAGVTLETIAVTESSVGTLITCNDLRRVRYGSNNYLGSNIRNWLNSDAVTYSPVKTHKYDVLSTAAPYSTGGFLKNLDPEFKAVIGPVKKQVAKNNVTDGGGQDLFEDKVFLLSRTEVYGGTEGDYTGEKPYEYYSLLAPAVTSAELSGRIKYLSGASRHWWLRSPYVGYSYIPRGVNTAGYISSSGACDAYGLAPACTIY